MWLVMNLTRLGLYGFVAGSLYYLGLPAWLAVGLFINDLPPWKYFLHIPGTKTREQYQAEAQVEMLKAMRPQEIDTKDIMGGK